LRRYDQKRNLVGSALPNVEFTRYDRLHPAEGAFLVGSKDPVGFYSVRSDEWVEVDLSGAVLGRWKGIGVETDFIITGVGIIARGSVYLSSRRRIPNRPGYTTPEYYVLDRASGNWSRMAASGWEGGI
jgi:hypothetical protein